MAIMNKARPVLLLFTVMAVLLLGQRADTLALMFARGDVFVALESGPVQWFHPNGRLERVLWHRIVGTGEGMGFDNAGNLYVTRWCDPPACDAGGTTEVFNMLGMSAGTFGTDYNCGPHAIVFDRNGNGYVGQAGCTGAIMKFASGQPPVSFPVAWDNQGSFWIDLAPDGCTMFYTSVRPQRETRRRVHGDTAPGFQCCPGPRRRGARRSRAAGRRRHCRGRR